MNLSQAQKIADNVLSLLSPHVDRISIAGSIRRKKPEVKDIEIVCEPKTLEIGDSLFDEKKKVVPIQEFVDTIRQWEKILGEPFGRYTKRKLPEGIMLDIFIPDPPDYYRQLAIRTGSRDFSELVLARAWRKLGWCGSDKGLRKTSDCSKSGKLWVCTNPNAELPPIWNSEQEFFQWLNVPYVEPELRNSYDPKTL
jgi:DNA polymerase/3'-5' exonuclease PolX